MKRIPVLTTPTARWRRLVFVFGVLGLWTITVFGLVPSVAVGAVPQLINFQGILKDGFGNPVADASYSVVFTIYDAPSGGINLWSETQSVTTRGGLFNVLLGSTNPVLDSAFNNPFRYLGVKVGADPEMTPRQQLMSLGYAFRVNSVDGASGGTITSKVSIGPGHTNTGLQAFVAGGSNTVSGDYATVGGGSDNVAGALYSTVSGGTSDSASGNHSTVGGGSDNIASSEAATVGGGVGNTARSPYSAIGGGQSNTATGNWSTVVGGGFNTASATGATVFGGEYNTASNLDAMVGGVANTASGFASTVSGGEFNKARGQYSIVSGGGGSSSSDSNAALGNWSAISGGRANIAAGDSSTVGGGTYNDAGGISSTVGGGFFNSAGGNFSAVAGGALNNAFAGFAAVSGGASNFAAAAYSTVGGGLGNIASGAHSTVAGGQGNGAGGREAAVAGGDSNVAQGELSAVGGGELDSALGAYSVVPGGRANKASGRYSFAAGRRAKAVNLGSFVWADSSADADFASTANNQFLIRAAGGVGIGTNSPAARLHVKGGGFPGSFGFFDTDAGGQDAGLRFQEAGVVKSHLYHQAGTNTLNLYGEGFSGLSVTSTGSVGVGTTAPAERLDVRGNVKLGSLGEFYATGGPENLKIIRGAVNSDGTALYGSGFTPSRTGIGTYFVAYSPGFSAGTAPVVSLIGGTIGYIGITGTGSASFVVETRNSGGALTDRSFSFIAAGPR